ncbi:MAG: DUF2851 family protein [Candidatus Cloacimonetes bacterium]|nr:DUF2851 family protein [Candidatus Cloacimonadota bacterium]
MIDFSEKFLYHIWDAGHLQNELKTVSGKKLTIKYHGRWNTGKGPDFINSILEIDDQVLRGDVEIHLRTYDWIQHSHQEDSNFNKVILHVVFQHNNNCEYTIKEDGTLAEILELKDILDMNITKLLQKYPDTYLEKEHLCDFFSGMDVSQTEKILQFLGTRRIDKKISRFKAETELIDWEQLLFQSLFESLGYSKNKFQMWQIATGIPYKKLHEFYRNGMSYEEMISIWLGSSSLFDHLPKTFSRDFISKWKNKYADQNYLTNYFEINWNLFRLRPSNHPAIRLIQISDLIYSSFETSLEKYLLKTFSLPKDNFDLKTFKKKYYQIFDCNSDIISDKYKIGKQRSDTIAVNIILPLMIIFAQKNSFFQLEKSIKEILFSYSGNPSNAIIKHMETGMEYFQKKLIRKKAIYQQGVFELYHNYCEHHICENCSRLKKEILEEL